jgi:hypothetical protein
MDEDSWKGLLASALSILGELESRGMGAPDFVLGGGTVLMMRYRHRLSKDVDLFLHDAQWLAYLTPRLNDHVAAMIRDYSEQANSVKLVLEDGDIDFIVSGTVTGDVSREKLEFQGRTIPLDTSAEILAKKLYFRAALLKPRDLFDLVVTHRADPLATGRALEASAPRRVEQRKRVDALKHAPLAELEKDILSLGNFRDLLPTLISDSAALLESAP